MDTVRYVIALLLVIILPFSFIFWLLIHPLAPWWRRRGPAFTYVVVGLIGVALAAIAYRFRGPLLAVEYGTSYPLCAAGVAMIAAAMYIGRQRRRHLTWRILTGLPELSSAAAPGPLLKEGIYGRTRHPRYVEALLGLCGYALIANYLAVYIAVAISFPLVLAIVLLEERELRVRFGAAYVDYCREVPRFLPHLARRSRADRSDLR